MKDMRAGLKFNDEFTSFFDPIPLYQIAVGLGVYFGQSGVVVPMPMGDKKNMRTAVLNKLAGDLAAAWRDPAQPVKLARSAFPLDRAEAYVQDQMHHLLDQGLAGWKVGATSQKMRELDGHDDVIPGRIFATRSYLGPKTQLFDFRFSKCAC